MGRLIGEGWVEDRSLLGLSGGRILGGIERCCVYFKFSGS